MIQFTTWERTNDQLSVFLKDSSVTTYTQDQRIDSWNAAQRVLAVTHTPRQGEVTLTIDSNGRSAIVPDDFLAVWRLYDSCRKCWMKQMRLPQRGNVRYDDDEIAQYWYWGGKIRFEQSIDLTSTDYILYYWGYWPDVEYATDGSTVVPTQPEIYVPLWSHLPLMHLTAATCLQPGALQAARDRNYAMKQVDSGTPVDNSRASQAREHLWWWSTLLAQIPLVQWRTAET